MRLASVLALFIIYSLTPAPASAAATFGGEAVIESTKLTNVSPIIEGTLRLHMNVPLSESFYTHARVRIHMINDKSYDSIDQTLFDRAYVGYKNAGMDVKVGKQHLFLGMGLLADLNTSGIQAIIGSDHVRLLGFYSDDVTAANIAFPLANGASFGFSTKKQLDSTWAANVEVPVGHAKWGAEFVKNRTTGKQGYLIQAGSGQYAVSYRDIEAAAIDPAWATNYQFADSKGIRIRADYKIGNSSILTLYQDFAKNHSQTEKKNITYAGYAVYF